MHIERLELKNYAGFEDFTLDFPEGNLCVLIGENGSGKTSVLEAIQMLIHAHLVPPSAKTAFWEKKLRKGAGAKFSAISISLKKNNFPTLSWRFAPKSINTMLHRLNNNSYRELEMAQHYAIISNIFKEIKNKNKVILTTISIPEIRSKLTFNNTNIPKMSIYEIGNFIKWYKDLVLYDVYMTKKYKLDYNPKEALEKAIMVFSGIKIDSQIGNSITELDVFFLKKDIAFTFEQLSQGEQKMINFIGQIIDELAPVLKDDTNDILSFPGIVLIDEIETHLHPRWQREILPNLTKTFPNVQFIVTTHSPFVIQSVEKAEQIINLDKDNSDIDPFRMSIEEIAEAYQHVEGVERSKRFKEMVAVAAEYFDLIEQSEGAENQGKINVLKARLDELETYYNDDPYFVALLQAERKTGFNKHLQI